MHPLNARRLRNLKNHKYKSGYFYNANSVWNPYQIIQFIKALEKVQMRATKL